MNLKNIKTFLCIVVLTICQYVRTNSADTERNDTYIKYIDDDSIVFEVDKSNYDTIEEDLIDISNLAISGGSSVTSAEQYPYMAVVHRLIDKIVVQKCGGTIISNRWVLTAGHCVANYPQIFFVAFGIINKSGIGHGWFVGPGVSMITTEVVLHPQYNLTHNDIALLHMLRDIPFSATIQPIKLSDHNYEGEVLANRYANIIGWGKTNITSQGTINLQYGTLPIITNYECEKYWHIISDKHICTAPGLKKDVCQGDSGGPLTITEDGEDIQIGITSYGNKQCPSDIPRVFTKVSSFVDWIHDVMNTYYK